MTNEIHPMTEQAMSDYIKELHIKKDKFILDENRNVIPATLMEWGEFLEDHNNRQVARDIVNGKLISTVFIGLDHSFNNKLHIFETMVFNEEKYGSDIYLERYSTWEQAEHGHKKAVQWVKDGCKDEQ